VGHLLLVVALGEPAHIACHPEHRVDHLGTQGRNAANNDQEHHERCRRQQGEDLHRQGAGECDLCIGEFLRLYSEIINHEAMGLVVHAHLIDRRVHGRNIAGFQSGKELRVQNGPELLHFDVGAVQISLDLGR